ncbi:xylulose kinase [Nocardia sp. NEAU-G5]|uniref:Xylulose kinase n=1 Tax=Nocardia albiluteola TaxID=2842303 RepID=A0ABS6AUY7_9NOCA|nr:FGGY family carbohydrate kinase [Nocardia albiluteola]MBU3061842.1 xylulose kinase [Nocardia albiluteola]
MAAQRVVIGLDSSTQATKAVAVDAESGQVLGEGRAPHTVSTGAGRESDPRQWWSALCAAIEQTGYAARAEALSIGGQQHGLVTLDAAGDPVRPALLWNDVRSAPQAAALVNRFGAGWWATRIGSVPNASFTAAKWAWLREHEPHHADHVAAVRLPHDYLIERLTGESVTDRGDVSGTAWWTPSGYDAEVLAAIGLDSAALPIVASPDRPAGHTRADIPVRQGIPVGVGTGDNMAAALGLGLAPGMPVLSLGTSGTVYARTRARPHDPTGVVAGFADAGADWLPLACTLNCTQAIDRIAALLSLDRNAVEPGGSAVVLPYLDGERTPQLPFASGLMHGLRHDTTPGQLLQAAYDGAVYSLLAALDLVLSPSSAIGLAAAPSAGGEADSSASPQSNPETSPDRNTARSDGDVPAPDPATPLLLIGGGARGTAWQQTVLRLSGRAVQIPPAGELVALGAAAQAAGLLTGEDPYAVARRWRTAEGPLLEPVPRDTEALERIAATLRAAEPLLTAGGAA